MAKGIENIGIQINAPIAMERAHIKPGSSEQPKEIGISKDSEEVNQKKRLGLIECETCSNRQYVDGSDDLGVSFKTPTKLSPNEASSKVISHEREHYFREAAKAEQENKEVLSNSIQIHTSSCAECGKTYVSGGLTTTVTKDKNKNDSLSAAKSNIANAAYGLNLDTKG